MNIVGIDYSKNSPGIVKFELDNDMKISNINYMGFTDVKKISDRDEKIIHYHKKQFSNDIEKAVFIRDNILRFIEDSNIDYVAFEGYAFAANGKVFDIAESTMCTKLALYERFIPIRIYDPNTIKMFSSGFGNADKIRMEEEFNKIPTVERMISLSHMPEFKSPKVDIIDAYFICKLLHMEIMLRKGMVQLKDMNEKQIQVFNRVTKSYPENILTRSFIKKVC